MAKKTSRSRPEVAARRDSSEDPKQEDRITMEVVVDAYGPEERAMGGIVTSKTP